MLRAELDPTLPGSSRNGGDPHHPTRKKSEEATTEQQGGDKPRAQKQRTRQIAAKVDEVLPFSALNLRWAEYEEQCDAEYEKQNAQSFCEALDESALEVVSEAELNIIVHPGDCQQNLEEMGDSDEDPGFANSSQGPPLGDLTRHVLYQFHGASVDHPCDFKIRLISPEAQSALNKLEDAMTDWYNDFYFNNPHSDIAEIFSSNYYAAYIPGRKRWVRCWVQGHVREKVALNRWYKSVLIHLLDYGTEEVVQRRNILPLRAKYLQLPIQAYRGKLDVMMPNYVDWDRATVKEFEGACEGEDFYAIVTGWSDQYPPYRTVYIVIYHDDTKTVDGVERPQQMLMELEGLKCGYMKVSPTCAPAVFAVATTHAKVQVPSQRWGKKKATRDSVFQSLLDMLSRESKSMSKSDQNQNQV